MQSYVEAASVRLAAFHSPPTPATIDRDVALVSAELRWTVPEEAIRSSYADLQEATEEGACAVAFATVMTEGYRVVKRLPKGTGADFFVLLPAGAKDEERHIRLEVSEIGAGRDRAAHLSRVQQKVDQLVRADFSPGLAVVVTFEAAIIYERSVE